MRLRAPWHASTLRKTGVCAIWVYRLVYSRMSMWEWVWERARGRESGVRGGRMYVTVYRYTTVHSAPLSVSRTVSVPTTTAVVVDDYCLISQGLRFCVIDIVRDNCLDEFSLS